MNDSESLNTAGPVRERVDRLLNAFQPDPTWDAPATVQKAAYLARSLQLRAAQLQTPQERRQQGELDRMIHNPHDKATLAQLTDQAFRSNVPHRAADQLVHILDVQGVPRFFGAMDRTLLKGFQSFGSYLPGVAIPLVKDKMQQETANVILPAETELLIPHLDARREEGVRMNVNYLGEALLGEKDAERRLNAYLQSLQLSQIEVMSVKISTIYSQITPLARRHAVAVLCNRMELLYRAAAKMRFTRTDGGEVPKFVYLDMEEYRDMSITAEVFMRTLDRAGLENVAAGIVLQAYIPDSFKTQQEINAWAVQRLAAGGAPITIRIVKGANMEMERVEASLQGWPQAPFREKVDTDANYKRMLNEGMRPENLAAVRLGIASHNLFDLAYGLVLAHEQDAMDRVQFEMLEGMANHQRRAIFELSRNLLLYAPACKKDDFINAIAYLIRRLDENTGPDNFLRHAFKVEVDGPEWQQLQAGFFQAFDRIDSLTQEPRRTQDRFQPAVAAIDDDAPWQRFVNEPDTDFSLPRNLKWAEQLIENWSLRQGEAATAIPLVIDGQEIHDDRSIRECHDPSRPGTVVGRYRQATGDDVNRAVDCAKSDPDGWRTTPPSQRSEILRRAAEELRGARADLLGAALADGGKTLAESDPEISEAVDFVEFYLRTAEDIFETEGLTARPSGVTVVVSPWNFPIAIPCGGVAAALAAGNTVILKPASDTVLPAYLLCQCFWRAGVSMRTLQLVTCRGATEGQQLVTHPDVDHVVLTGGTETALTMLAAKLDMNLLAETGGKNATVVTSLADRDQAIKHVLQSAFGHSGQKCSATSLLILEDEVYNDPQFKATLCDAVQSLRVGSAWQLESRVGPLIRPASGLLEKALKELEPGESWAVRPHHDEHNPHLYSPAVKWDVSRDSLTHTTEFFGPVLGVMRARNLHDAIDLVNATGYGLTSGLESLDDREQQLWQRGIRAGNLYINRSTTGAIVLRQPFGGMGKSAFGPGIKAGGPNYVAQLMQFADGDSAPTGSGAIDPQLDDLSLRLRALEDDCSYLPAEDLEATLAAVGSYDFYMRAEFGTAHDHFKLVGQDNLRRYLPVSDVRIRVDSRDTAFEILARVCAAKTVGARITVSSPPDFQSALVAALDNLTASWAGAIEFVEESDAELAKLIQERFTDRVRYAAADRVPDSVRVAAHASGLYVADRPVLVHGRIELLWYLVEQSLCIDYHRYGNLGERSEEQRAATC